MIKVCLLTTAQPSTNPRLVKEADALAEAGYDVQVFCASVVDWAVEADKSLLASRAWRCTYVAGHKSRTPRDSWIRLRSGTARRLLDAGIGSTALSRWTVCRVLPELERAATSICADLYIAHNLGALPAAVAGAKKHGAKLGFDAEDFHSGMGESAAMTNLIEQTERRCLPQCDYVTAGSPQIAQAYAAKYDMAPPVSILNVFPLSQRPPQLRLADANSPLTLYWFSQTIGAQRGIEDVVRAMGLLPDWDIRLHLRGNWQAGYQEHLLKLAVEVGVLPEKIIGHHPDAADAMAHLAAPYDIGLALEHTADQNRDICLTNKIFTYLLAGDAVIATQTAAQQALLQVLGDAARGYEPGDIETLARHLKAWHDDRDALQRAREVAWEAGASRYNWDLEKQKFLQIVRDVLAATKKSSR